ncbi:tRNA-splicing endonuclease subunit Sen34 isoform X2 [Schistocerca cancellata]|uniref:tRNA-splicing endonuclease subunit Sen34 isoform X1 n=1 Tax=Schistocerca cancellata TaxID=274614 RepID=UPI002117F0FE|nr:tRNA-splicing endonuclease subunit Sen34 isoform X1 [Schistocerca cancellata]XP_049784504.1 tRNA-splicing endonuclease subunit Sen34 isoform X2 [Schistocerca cancellata]
MMITLTVSDGKAFVWNADDWLTLREQHRIIGNLIGCLPHMPRQETFLGLPLELLPEEATLLVEKKIATLARFPSLSRAPGSGIQNEYEKYRKRIYEEQTEHLMQSRREQVTNMIDKIVEGKKLKLMGVKKSKRKKTESPPEEALCDMEDIVIDKEELLKEEFAKIKPVTIENTLVQIFSVYPWLRQEDACPVRWEFPKSPLDKIRYKVFKDLWDKGYYMTSGKKFGGDFLVYRGDPLKFHAHFLILCKERECSISLYEFITFGRLGTNVRKKAVIATLSEDGDLIYQSVKWRDRQR